jgi:FkbM family methyltransferase
MVTFKKIGEKAARAAQRLLRSNSQDSTYRIGRLEIDLPSGHKLPIYQEAFPQYDRFLPHLAKYLASNSYVIDVGANCADTLAGMIDSNPKLNFLCVEADEHFYHYLTTNASRIQKIYSGSRIKTVKCLAGCEINNVTMMGFGGTKKAVTSTNTSDMAISSQSLDSIVQSQGIDSQLVSLVKTDTDGYDWDVMNSASSLLADKTPMVFFECQYDDEEQMKKYKLLINSLARLGYKSWTVFDNFGGVLLRDCATVNIHGLIDYVWHQNTGRSRRTIHYLDILAATDDDISVVKDAIDNY